MYVYSRVRAMDGTEGGCRHLCRLRLGDLALAWSCVIAGEKMVPERLSVTSCAFWMDVERCVACGGSSVCWCLRTPSASPFQSTLHYGFSFFFKKKTRLGICYPLRSLHRPSPGIISTQPSCSGPESTGSCEHSRGPRSPP
jgi:hypothetical protein